MAIKPEHHQRQFTALPTRFYRQISNPQTTPSLFKMSMFGIGRPQPSSAEKIAAAEQEMDLVTDMFAKFVTSQHHTTHCLIQGPFANYISRLSRACMKKCIPNDYREGELNKGEGVCIDRCAAKFFDVQMKVSEILQAEAQAKGAGGAQGPGGMGFGGM